jgi:hypothetical protein
MSLRETFIPSRPSRRDIKNCHHCHLSTFEEDETVVCAKCKNITCTSCQEDVKTECEICEKSLCSQCLDNHFVSECKDCDVILCFNTQKRTSDLLKKEHIYCCDCKKYSCSKLPPPHLKRFMKSPNMFKQYCSHCIWKQIKCYFCKITLNRSPYICVTCNAPVCEDCKCIGHFASDVRQCRGCELRTTRDELKRTRNELKKIRSAYILSTIHPIIKNYVKDFIKYNNI